MTLEPSARTSTTRSPSCARPARSLEKQLAEQPDPRPAAQGRRTTTRCCAARRWTACTNCRRNQSRRRLLKPSRRTVPMSYQPPVRDHLFLLARRARARAATPTCRASPTRRSTSVEQILDEAARFCAEVLAPLNKVGDKEGCVWIPDNTVTTPPGFKEAYQAHGRGRLAGAGRRVRPTAARACRRWSTWPSARCARRPTWRSPCTRA